MFRRKTLSRTQYLIFHNEQKLEWNHRNIDYFSSSGCSHSHFPWKTQTVQLLTHEPYPYATTAPMLPEEIRKRKQNSLHVLENDRTDMTI